MLHVNCLPHYAGGADNSMSERDDVRARELNNFFSEVERRALRMAGYALHNPDDALEAVQEAMLGLVERYAGRPGEEWGPLFYTILQSRIRDRQRKAIVRQKVAGFLPGGLSDDNDADPVQQAADPGDMSPERRAHSDETAVAIDRAIGKLPYRQQQTFLLRIWEGMSVKATASVLKCSEGSVKTHLSRALAALRAELGDLYEY